MSLSVGAAALRTADRQDRAAGALLGCAVGDALGAPYEFTVPKAGFALEMTGGGVWEPGEWTDDTAMTVAVARAAADGHGLVEPDGLDAVAAGFVGWFDSGPKDIGILTRRVLRRRPDSGAEMAACARSRSGRKGGNGSLMRTAPVGLACLADADRCLDAAAAVSDLTHADERARQASQMWSYAIRHAVLHGTLDGVDAWLDETDADARTFWATLLHDAPDADPSRLRPNGWVVRTVQTVWRAIRITSAGRTPAEHFAEAIRECIATGNDTDTTAAIAGALLCAAYGAHVIPDRWLQPLHGWPGMGADELRELAVACAFGR